MSFFGGGIKNMAMTILHVYYLLLLLKIFNSLYYFLLLFFNCLTIVANYLFTYIHVYVCISKLNDPWNRSITIKESLWLDQELNPRPLFFYSFAFSFINPGLYPQFLRIKQLQYQKVSFWEWLKQD